MTKENQLLVGLLVCETVLEALIRTHPNKEVLRPVLAAHFAGLEKTALIGDEPLGVQELEQMKVTMNAFLWQLDEHRQDAGSGL